MDAPGWADLVMLNLNYGADRAKTIGELAESMHCPRRMVEKGIEQLRQEGRPVITGSGGVWLAQTGEEIRECADRLNRRLVTQYQTVRAMRRTAMRYERFQQMELFG